MFQTRSHAVAIPCPTGVMLRSWNTRWPRAHARAMSRSKGRTFWPLGTHTLNPSLATFRWTQTQPCRCVCDKTSPFGHFIECSRRARPHSLHVHTTTPCCPPSPRTPPWHRCTHTRRSRHACAPTGAFRQSAEYHAGSHQPTLAHRCDTAGSFATSPSRSTSALTFSTLF